MSVTFATFCHPPHLPKLHAPGILEEMVKSHKYPFDEIIIVHQRCQGLEYRPIGLQTARIVESENHPDILNEFGLPETDEKADHYTHGPTAPHYWKWHVINHLIAAKEAVTDYIVFSDADCRIKESPDQSWIKEGIGILERYSDIFMISPGDGGHMAERRIPEARLTQNISQQLFLVSRFKFLEANLNIPWDWEFLAPGGPMQEYYYMLEGRIWRYLHQNNLWRAILPDTWRYWHYQW